MIGKILLTLAVIAVVIVAARLFGSASGRAGFNKKAAPKEIERKEPKADDLSWDETTKSYRPKRDIDKDKG
jgi:hypothetical protein